MYNIPSNFKSSVESNSVILNSTKNNGNDKKSTFIKSIFFKSSAEKVAEKNNNDKKSTFIKSIFFKSSAEKAADMNNLNKLPDESQPIQNTLVEESKNDFFYGIDPVKAPQFQTVNDLVNCYQKCWKNGEYENIPFEEDKFLDLVNENIKNFSFSDPSEATVGYIEKRDLEANSKIFVRADLHGDLRSLMENLQTLKEQGLLDENFKCKSHVQLIFLGDYSDRGNHSLEVLSLLLALRLENPDQVTLIRGNHESIKVNSFYKGNKDVHFIDFLKKEETKTRLDQLYSTFPLTVYMGEEGQQRQYVQFTHGLFEWNVNPQKMLEGNGKIGRRKITHENFDPESLESNESSIQMGAKKQKYQESYGKVKRLIQSAEEQEQPNLSPYNWGDMADKNDQESSLGQLGDRDWKIIPEDVHHYLRFSSGQHKVRLIFRGHEHLKQHHAYNGKKGDKVIVSTMPVGMDSSYAKRYPDQKDTAYILSTALKVKDWKKKAYTRKSFSEEKFITKDYEVRSEEI